MAQPRSNAKQIPRRRRTGKSVGPARSISPRKESGQTVTVPVSEERIHVGKRQHNTGRVSVRIVPQNQIETIDVPLIQETAEVQRVPVNRVVDAPTPVRQEGDMMVVPVFEEILVVEKKLVLREEVHIRLQRTTRHETQKVRVRKENVEITRSPKPS